MGALKGIDVSSWQHGPNGDEAIDWHAVKTAGIDFVIVKATQGNTYISPWLKEDVHGALDAGLLTGAYHFVDVGVPGKEQAAHYVAAVMGLELAVGSWIDWEIPLLPDWDVTSLYTELMDTVHETRHDTGLYTESWWYETFKRLNLKIPRLWTAGNWSVSDAAQPFIRQGTTAEITGIIGPVDTDVLTSSRGVNVRRVNGSTPHASSAPPQSPTAAPVGDESPEPATSPADADDPQGGAGSHAPVTD